MKTKTKVTTEAKPRSRYLELKTMLEDRNVFVRRIREGYEFFSTMAKRRPHLAEV